VYVHQLQKKATMRGVQLRDELGVLVVIGSDKSEIRNSKSETNPKDRIPKSVPNSKSLCPSPKEYPMTNNLIGHWLLALP
jgi:hypothetical protein